MLPTIGERPPAPQDWPLPHVPGVQLERHHIVPFSMVRTAWNHLVNAFFETELPDARTTLRQFIQLFRYRDLQVDDLLDEIRQNALDVVRCNALGSEVTWPPWNIVEGPANRSDDPDDRYLDRFNFGVTRDEFTRMGHLENLYRSLERFNGVIPAPPANLQALAESLRQLRGDLGPVATRIMYRPVMWEQDPDGRWHKRRTGEQFFDSAAVPPHNG